MAKSLQQNENGEWVEVDYLEIRNKEIIEKLEPTLKEFIKEKNLSYSMKKPVKLGYRFTTQLYLALSKYGQMSPDNVAKLDYDTINDFWLKFLELTAYYNRYFEIVSNRQLFCAFMGINNRIYLNLEKSQDEDIANLMRAINDSFIGLGFTAGESGEANHIAVKARLGAKDVGHNVVSASEELVANALTGQKSPQELDRQLARILGEELPKSKRLKP